MVERFKQASQLIDYFKTQYVKKYGTRPTISRTKAKYQFSDALQDFTIDELKSIIDYYLTIEREPTLNKLVSEYPELSEKMKHDKKSEIERKQLLQETKNRVMEFRRLYGK